MHLRKSGLILRRLLAGVAVGAAVRVEAAVAVGAAVRAEAAVAVGAAVRAEAAVAAAVAAATSGYAVILSALDFFSYASVPSY